MSFDKYYDGLYNNNEIDSKYVSFLAMKHIKNFMSKKDLTTNKTIVDTAYNYVNRYIELLKTMQYPLGFLYDDIYDMYLYTRPHFKRILDNPFQSIVKENKLIQVNKLKEITPKTMEWLSTKPGATFREKLAMVNKVSSTVKKYSFNIPPNQMYVKFFNKLYKLLLKKIKIIEENPELFGPISKLDNIPNLKHDLQHLDYKIKNTFEDVIAKDLVKPNNTILGNVDYRSLWNSYVNLSKGIVDVDINFYLMKLDIYKLFILTFMVGYQVIEAPLTYDDIDKYVLYNISNNEVITLEFNLADELEIIENKYLIKGGKIILDDTIRRKIELIENDKKGNRGIGIELHIDGSLEMESFVDLEGLKQLILKISDVFDLCTLDRKNNSNKNVDFKYISINSYDNLLIGSKKTQPHIISDVLDYIPNELYDVMSNNEYLCMKDSKSYSSLLRDVYSNYNMSKVPYIIYDIQDDFDEFSSANIRRQFTSIYNKNYPAWRSILAAESINNNSNINIIVDLCGKDFSITKLGYNKKRFVHYGPIDIPIYLQKFTEDDFCNKYIAEYMDEYNVMFPEEVIIDWKVSGKLHNLFLNKCGIISYDSQESLHPLFYISYNEDIFNRLEREWLTHITSLQSKEKGRVYIIVPDYINIEEVCGIHNSDLEKGADVIASRLEKGEITWYEMLPDLSLEVILDGMYDRLSLVDDKMHENIIGKKIDVSPKDTFVLEKGQKNYILPLNKSFIGIENKNFVAKIEDKSFPLEEDVEVKLKIEYAFGSENSYLLYLLPVDRKAAPFKRINVEWEELDDRKQIIDLNITDVIFTKDTLNEAIEDYRKKMMIFSTRCDKVLNWNYKEFQRGFTDLFESLCKDLRISSNRKQRLCHYSPEVKYIIGKINDDFNLSDKIFKIYKLLPIIFGYCKKNNIKLRVNTAEFEEGMIEYTFDKNMFLCHKLRYPEYCYGRYFAEVYDDEEIINEAYNDLILLSKKPNLYDSRLTMYIQRLTSSTAVNHKVMRDMTQINATYVLYVLKVCVQYLKDACETSIEGELNYDHLRDVGYILASCIELIIALLFCRDNILFEDLRPGGNIANQIIYYLKIINKKYITLKRIWPREIRKLKMKTKYHISINMPDNLYHVTEDIYCLILCLSGDERTNLIKVSQDVGKDNKVNE